MSKIKSKYFMCGFDGMDFPVLKSNIVHFPNLGKLWKRSCRGTMYSKAKITGISWTSIYTGVHKEKHGIRDMWGRKTDKSLDFVSTKQKYIWDYFNKHGLTTAVFNMPVTHPLRSVSGWLVSGFPAPTNSKIAFPDSIADDLPPDYLVDWINSCMKDRDLHPQVWIKETFDLTTFLEDLERMELARVETFIDLCKKHPTDTHFFQSTVIDRVLHIQGITNNNDVRVYRIADKIIKRIFKEFEPERFQIVSDHGGWDKQHTHTATWLTAGVSIKPGEILPPGTVKTNEVDVLPTALFWMGFAPPAGDPFDGEIFYDAFITDLNEEEQKKIEDQLRALGYLD